MITLLLVLQVIIVGMLVLVIMLQKSSSDSLAGLSGGGANTLLSRSSTDIVSKATITLAALFLANSIAIANCYNKSSSPESIVDAIKLHTGDQEVTANAIKTPIVPKGE